MTLAHQITAISLLMSINLVSLASTSSNSELLKFSEASCFFWYFKGKGYDTSDIKKVTSGIVQMGSLSPEKYQQASLLVKEYKIKTETKHAIDPELMKCFMLEDDKEFLSALEQLGKS